MKVRKKDHRVNKVLEIINNQNKRVLKCHKNLKFQMDYLEAVVHLKTIYLLILIYLLSI
jgi:hypothetical protein